MKTITKANYVIIDECSISDPMSEKEIFERVNGERALYIKDEVDPLFIKENFPEEITTLSKAEEWLSGMGSYIIEVPNKLNSTQRILSRLFENNGAITGRIKIKKETYSDQGYWDFTIKILDIDEEFRAIFQIKADKKCPSGISDNGIYTVDRPLVSLYEFKRDIDAAVRTLITRYFRSNEGVGGSSYKIIRFTL